MEKAVLKRIFEPYSPFEYNHPRYSIKILDQIVELKEVIELRSRIFAEEYNIEGLKNQMDIDEFDFVCDHLIIKDNQTGKLVGTYRILCSKFTNKFYSTNEFELDAFLKSDGIKLELGRACIEKNYRKGSVLSLLWRGVVQYAIRTKADYLFGCSSVKTESYINAQNLNEAFSREGYSDHQWAITPKKEYCFTEFEKNNSNYDFDLKIPSLLRSYLAAGAKIYGEPAFDREFHCLDYLTILKLDELKVAFEKRYNYEC